MTGIQDDLATLRRAIGNNPIIDDALTCVEDEIARLGNALAQERSKPEGSFDQWARLQAAEAEVARLRDGLRRLAVGEGNAMLLARALLAEDDATLSKVSPNDSNDLDFGGAS